MSLCWRRAGGGGEFTTVCCWFRSSVSRARMCTDLNGNLQRISDDIPNHTDSLWKNCLSNSSSAMALRGLYVHSTWPGSAGAGFLALCGLYHLLTCEAQTCTLTLCTESNHKLATPSHACSRSSQMCPCLVHMGFVHMIDAITCFHLQALVVTNGIVRVENDRRREEPGRPTTITVLPHFCSQSRKDHACQCFPKVLFTYLRFQGQTLKGAGWNHL